MKRLFCLLLIGFLGLHTIAQSEIRMIDTPTGSRIQILHQGKVHLQSPPEGIWTIATGWNNQWPDTYSHAITDSIVFSGDYTIMSGRIQTGFGDMLCRDAYKIDRGMIRCTRRFEWTGTDTLRKATLSIRFAFPSHTKSIMMPGILYYGNPSGERSGNTPWYHGTPGERAIFEEHRFPMPFVSAEWEGKDGELLCAAIHSQPSPVPYAHLKDQWWSLGVDTRVKETEMVLLTGPCAFNGQNSRIKAQQGGEKMAEAYDEAWMNIPPGAIVEKTFWIEVFTTPHPGSGFQKPVHSSLALFNPASDPTMPGFDEIVRNKIDFAQTRYYEDGQVAGFRKYPDRNFFVLGWCGQSAASGYAFQVLKQRFDIPHADQMIQNSLNFLSTSEFYDSGFYTWYHTDENRWFMNHTPEWLSQGQAMLNFANAIRVARQARQNPDNHETLYAVSAWEAFLVKASDFHSRRILDAGWHPESTNEAFFIEPLCRAYELFNTQSYLEAAVKAAHHYAKRSLSMQEPYWGGTLDASCEDKEGAFAALQGFLSLYEVTGDAEFLQWARHAGDVCLTYLVVWDIPMPAGRLTDHAFKTRGWTAVSVQNMHIDVYGVLIAPYIYKLGKITGDQQLMSTGELMFRTCGQLIDPFGSQGEQPYHTNYIQTSWLNKPIWERRGNYLETWTVFWITAHFLNAAAMFEEMGHGM